MTHNSPSPRAGLRSLPQTVDESACKPGQPIGAGSPPRVRAGARPTPSMTRGRLTDNTRPQAVTGGRDAPNHHHDRAASLGPTASRPLQYDGRGGRRTAPSARADDSSGAHLELVQHAPRSTAASASNAYAALRVPRGHPVQQHGVYQPYFAGPAWCFCCDLRQHTADT